MKLLTLCSILCTLLSLSLARRETQSEAVIHARELIQYRAYNTGVLMSTYKETTVPGGDDAFLGLPFGLQEYFAVHPDGSGDLILLAMPIATIYRNAMAPYAPNMTITISDTYGFGDGNLAAGRYRVALFGTLSTIPLESVPEAKSAYLAAHSDARGWIPPNGPHSSYWARFTVEKVYCFDGFGNVAYIGFVPLEEYRAASKLMRSEKEVKKHWPIPEQPEENEVVEFEETSSSSSGIVEEEDQSNEGRLRIQL